MERERLTILRISDFSCPPGKQQAFLWDTTSPRLAVRATAAGAKSFIFESKLNRQTIRRTIGDCSDWTIDDARAEARRLQTIIDRGDDPRELERERKVQKAAKEAEKVASQRQAEDRQRYTLRALCNAYADYLESRGKVKSAGAARSAFKCHVFGPHSAIAETPAREITARQLAAIVRKVIEANKDRTAGTLRAYLSAAFNNARKAPFDAGLPAALIPFNIGANPVEPIATIPVRASDRTLTPKELKAYMGALGNDHPDQALKLALLAGGQRMAQLLRAKLTDYDAQQRILRLIDPKGKRITPREHLLPLAPKGAALVAMLVKRAEKMKSPWLFSITGEHPLDETAPGKRAAEIGTTMEGEPFNLRDIRRTAETMLAGMGISRDTRAQLLSHGISGVQAAHYDRHSYIDEKRAALVAWEAKLDEIEKGRKAPGNVRQLRGKSKTAA